MKIRIIEKGFEGFTGDFGSIPFKNGVSTREVTYWEAQRLANIIQVETLEGENPSSSQLVLDNACLRANIDLVQDLNTGEISAPERSHKYTREELEAIFDQKGIAGLRAVAEPFKVKSTTGAVLIDKILAAQDGLEKSEPFEEEKMVGGIADAEKAATAAFGDGKPETTIPLPEGVKIEVKKRG